MTDKVKNQVEQFIKIALLKRGLTSPIIEFEIDEYHQIKIKTAEFQTQPVLFESIHIDGYGIYNRPTESEGVFGLSISLNFKYNLFGGGSNGSDLLNIFGEYNARSIDLKVV